MTKQFSGNEIIEMGIQIERKGYGFYTVLEKSTKNIKLSELFKWLAIERMDKSATMPLEISSRSESVSANLDR